MVRVPDVPAILHGSYVRRAGARLVVAGARSRRGGPRKARRKEKSGRQVTVSTDLVYDVLREHEPDHILLQATREDAATGLLDIHRLGDLLARIKGQIIHKNLKEVSPLAVPIMLEIGRETVVGEANETLLAEAAENLISEAMTV